MLWDHLLSVISTIGNLCIIVITLYTFYLGFISKRIKVMSISRYRGDDGESIAFLLKNRNMRTLAIQEVVYMSENGFDVPIGRWEEDNIFATKGVA